MTITTKSTYFKKKECRYLLIKLASDEKMSNT